MKHSTDQIIRITIKAVIDFEKTQKLHKRGMYGRIFRYNDFAVWVLAKKRDYRKGDVAMKIIKMIWMNPTYIGFKVCMGRFDKIYTFDLKATDKHYTNQKLWRDLI